MVMNRRDFLKWGAAAAGSLILPRLSFGYSAKAHTSLTELAIKLIRQSEHHPDFDHDELVTQIIKGSVEEDLPVTNCAQHYRNPERPEGQQGLIFPILNDGSKDALTRAQQLWQQSIELYHAGKLPEAYHTLGRVCHLLEDMASPEHVYLVDHSIVKIVTKDGSLLNREFLEKLGRHLNLDEIDLTRSTLQSGSTYEKQCEDLPLEELVDLAQLKPLEKATPKAYFDSLARESLHSEITPLIQRHIQLGQTGNGTYINAKFEPEETKTIYHHLAPKTIGSVAGLLKMWEKEIKQGPVKRKNAADFSEGFLFIGLDHQTKKNGLYKLSLDGKNLTKLLDANSPDSFSFDFDARRNLLVAELDGKIVTMNLDGGERKIIFSQFPACRPQITEQGIIIKKYPLDHDEECLNDWFRLNEHKPNEAEPIFKFTQPSCLYYGSSLNRGGNLYWWANNREPHYRWDSVPIPRFSPDGQKMALVLPQIGEDAVIFEKYLFIVLDVNRNSPIDKSWIVRELGSKLGKDIAKSWQEYGLEPSRKERATCEEIVWAPDSSAVFFDGYLLKANKFLAVTATPTNPVVFNVDGYEVRYGLLMEDQKPQKIDYPLSKDFRYKCGDISEDKRLVLSCAHDFLYLTNLSSGAVEKLEYRHKDAYEGSKLGENMPYCHSPAFFPDGKKIAFVYNATFLVRGKATSKEGTTDILVVHDLESKKFQEMDLFPLCGITTPRPVLKN